MENVVFKMLIGVRDEGVAAPSSAYLDRLGMRAPKARNNQVDDDARRACITPDDNAPERTPGTAGRQRKVRQRAGTTRTTGRCQGHRLLHRQRHTR